MGVCFSYFKELGYLGRIQKFAEFITSHASDISIEIIEFNIRKIDIELPKEKIEESKNNNSKFIQFLGETLNLTDDEVLIEFTKWHKEHFYREHTELSLSEISSLIKPYAEVRLQLVRMITQIAIEQGLSTDEVLTVSNRISFLLDISVTNVIIEREHHSEQINKKNQKIITELSSPIVPIQNGTAVLPIIGELNASRSEHIIANVPRKLSELNIDNLIIDFSGLVTIDNEVSDLILSIYNVLKLLGLKTIFTGIRPDLSRKIVKAGIDFSSLKTYGTVQQAINSLSWQLNSQSF